MFDGERTIIVFGVASPKSEKKKKSFPYWGFRDRWPARNTAEQKRLDTEQTP